VFGERDGLWPPAALPPLPDGWLSAMTSSSRRARRPLGPMPEQSNSFSSCGPTCSPFGNDCHVVLSYVDPSTQVSAVLGVRVSSKHLHLIMNVQVVDLDVSCVSLLPGGRFLVCAARADRRECAIRRKHLHCKIINADVPGCRRWCFGWMIATKSTLSGFDHWKRPAHGGRSADLRRRGGVRSRRRTPARSLLSTSSGCASKTQAPPPQNHQRYVFAARATSSGLVHRSCPARRGCAALGAAEA
jgi:hypothetical protein